MIASTAALAPSTSMAAAKASGEAAASRSMGLASAAPAGTRGRSSAMVASGSATTSSPAAAHASAHRIPRPPPLVTTPTRGPAGGLMGEQGAHVEQLLQGVV